MREFGVRFAIGATPAEVLRMVIRDGVRLAAIGAAAGTAGAIASARAFQALVFAVQPWDAATLAACAAGALILAAAAALASAIRASRLNPADALRSE